MAEVWRWDPLVSGVFLVVRIAYLMDRIVSRHLVIGTLCEKQLGWSVVLCTLVVGLIHVQSSEVGEWLGVRMGSRQAWVAQTLFGVK